MSKTQALFFYEQALVRDITEQILKYPKVIWGGTFTLWKENDKTMYKTSENFYPIAKTE